MKLDLTLNQNFVLNCDNLQTVWLMIQDILKLVTKLRHIDIYQHWLYEQVKDRRIEIEQVKTTEMPADRLTKVLPYQKHENFIWQLKMLDIA